MPFGIIPESRSPCPGFPTLEEQHRGDPNEALEVFETTKPPLQLVDFSGFHFAMSPLWYPKAPSSHRQIFQSEEDLISWFSNLSGYIAGQLTYVGEKAGRRITVNEFR